MRSISVNAEFRFEATKSPSTCLKYASRLVALGPPVGTVWPKRGNPHKLAASSLRSGHAATASDPCAGRRGVLDGGRERAAGRPRPGADRRRLPEGVLPPHGLGRRRSLHRALLPRVRGRALSAV